MKASFPEMLFQKFSTKLLIDSRLEKVRTIDDPIQYSREQATDIIFRTIAFLATAALLILPTFLDLSWGDPQVIGYVIIVAIVWIVTLSKRFSYHFRTSFILFAMCAIGVYDLLMVGLVEDSRVWFFMFIICATILAGRRPGALAILVSVLLILGVGLAQTYHLIDIPELKYGVDDLTTRIVYTSAVAFMTAATTTYIPIVIILQTVNRLFAQMNALRQEQETTNQKLQRTSLELEDALKAQENLNAIQTTVLRTVSHEFRTPLSVISLYSSLLNRHREKLDSAKTDQYINEIMDSVDHLSALLSNVLSVYNIQEHLTQLSYQSISSKAVISAWQALIHGRKKVQEKREIQLVIVQACEQPLYTDLFFVNHAFVALLDNAIRYSAELTPIIVTYRWDGRTLHWMIEDEGIGIPEADLECVFQPFYRADNGIHIPGVGVGLHLVESIVGEMGGTVTLANRPNQNGIIATVDIPAHEGKYE